MEEQEIEKIKWASPEYINKDHSNDWFWTVALVAIVGCIVAVWFKSYVFAIFIFISGISLVMFAIKQSKILEFTISNKGIVVNNEEFLWKNLKSFNVKIEEDMEFNKLFIETNKNFLPIYTFLIPKEMTDSIKKEIAKKIVKSEINESRTIQIAEKMGF